jgi:hypothetical protein
MLLHTRLEHRFVHHIPEQIDRGVIYISIEFATAVHTCCCGCGEEVVTPFTPTDWSLTFDGETISISPSIGNWNFACRSHYFIDQGRVIEALPWKKERIDRARRSDANAKALYYEKDGDNRESSDSPKANGLSEKWRSGLSRKIRTER